MYSGVRRTPQELHTLYRLYPDTRDVVVEGAYDAGLVTWFLREAGAGPAIVYAVDDRVEITSEEVDRTGYDRGARGRVAATALLAAESGARVPNLTCIIDADRDCFSGAATRSPLLLTTDFADMTAYCLQPRVISRFLHAVGRGSEDPERVLARCVPALNELFVVRHVLHSIGPGIPLIDKFSACCRVSNGAVAVDAAELVRRSAHAADAAARVAHLVKALDEFRKLLPQDRVCAARGHDVSHVLVQLLALSGDFARASTVAALLRASIHLDDLETKPMFETLLRRVATTSA